ncbi:Uncharacterized protein HZ326_31051, partial [Fusarium oxysporum f. sp. albedinis]
MERRVPDTIKSILALVLRYLAGIRGYPTFGHSEFTVSSQPSSRRVHSDFTA